MIYLSLAVLCSVIVSILLKIARRNKVVLSQAIALNYAMAFGLNAILFKPQIPSDWATLSWEVFMALGILLPAVFIIMGKAVEYAGIAKSDAAQRLSLILPIVAAIIIFGETIADHKIVGIVLAFIALLCLLVSNNSDKDSQNTFKGGLILIGVWLGYGVIDILLKRFSQSPSQAVSLAVMFAIAFILMMLYLLLINRQHWSLKSILGGLILGVFNFFNILFYIKAHQHFKTNPTLVFTSMNIGVIALGSIVGTVIFREKLRVINMVGIAFAIAAVFVLFYGNQFI